MKTFQTAVPLEYKNQRYYVNDLGLALQHLWDDMETFMDSEDCLPHGKPKVFVRYTAVLEDMEHRYDTYYVMECAGKERE